MSTLGLAVTNLATLGNNSYPGRGVAAGLHKDNKHLVQIVWIMGRRPGSRNRVYTKNGGRVFTKLAKPDPAADTSLTLYEAMMEVPRRFYVASNGEQTHTAIDGLESGRSFLDCMADHLYEPDAPIFTPRITALCPLGENSPCVMLSIICKSSDGTTRRFWRKQGDSLPPGIGWTLQTYKDDGDPPLSYEGEPYALPLVGPIDFVARRLWNALNSGNRVALAVKFIPLDRNHSSVHIINKFTKES